MDEFAQHLFDQANALNERFAAGLKASKAEAKHDILLLCAVYDRVIRAPSCNIPGPLHIEIERLRKKYCAQVPDQNLEFPRR